MSATWTRDELLFLFILGQYIIKTNKLQNVTLKSLHEYLKKKKNM